MGWSGGRARKEAVEREGAGELMFEAGTNDLAQVRLTFVKTFSPPPPPLTLETPRRLALS